MTIIFTARPPSQQREARHISIGTFPANGFTASVIQYGKWYGVKFRAKRIYRK